MVACAKARKRIVRPFGPVRGAAFPAAGQFGHRLRHLHARRRRPCRDLEPGRASASRAIRPRRSSASISRASSRRRIAPPACRRGPCATAAARRPVRGRGLARAQGRHALLGPCRHRSDPRRATASCSASPRSPATSPTGAGRSRRCSKASSASGMLVQGVRDYAIYMLDTEGRVTNWNAGARGDQGL